MSKPDPTNTTFIYDGDCPICTAGVNNFCLRKEEGTLQRINKRDAENNPIFQEMESQELSANAGMVIHYKGKFYQGADALHLMSQIGDPQNGWANRISHQLFRYKWMATLSFPIIRLLRKLLLIFKGSNAKIR